MSNQQEEKLYEDISVLSFQNSSDIVVVTIPNNVRNLSQKSMKELHDVIKDQTKHNTIIVPENVKIAAMSKEETIAHFEKLIEQIKSFSDDEPAEISW